MISAVFHSVLPEISTSLVLHNLLRSFRVEAPARSVTPPSWDLLKVLEYLNSPVFDPFASVLPPRFVSVDFFLGNSRVCYES